MGGSGNWSAPHLECIGIASSPRSQCQRAHLHDVSFSSSYPRNRNCRVFSLPYPHNDSMMKVRPKRKQGCRIAPQRKWKCRAVVSFPNLQADDFRHPLDRQNTALLRAVPGLNEFGKILLGPVSEQVMLLENIGTSVHVTENQAVLAHELGHLKCDHGIWLTFANILTLGAYTIPGLGSFIAQTFEEQLFRWVRAAELTCDRAALLVVQDPKVVISVLMKLAGGCPSLAGQLNVDAFLEQARSYDAASSNPLGWYLRNAQTRQLSHPLPVLRAREVDQWARNPQYKALLERASAFHSKSKPHLS